MTASTMTQLVLPELPYAYDALEPWCDSETLHLHHDKHHRAYVDKANAALEELRTVDPSDAARYAGLEAAREFNLGGHVLHSLFWENLSPEPVRPAGAVAEHLDAAGGVDRVRSLLTAACMGVQGSGWGVLAFDTASRSLQVGMVHDHHAQHVPGSDLVAVVDVWEHAYYLSHRNDRAAWVSAAIDHLDWAAIDGRLDAVTASLAASS